MTSVLIEELKTKAYTLAEDIESLNEYLYSDAIKDKSDEYVDVLRNKQTSMHGYFVSLMSHIEFLKHI